MGWCKTCNDLLPFGCKTRESNTEKISFTYIICSALEAYFKKGRIEYTKPYWGGYKEVWGWSFTE